MMNLIKSLLYTFETPVPQTKDEEILISSFQPGIFPSSTDEIGKAILQRFPSLNFTGFIARSFGRGPISGSATIAGRLSGTDFAQVRTGRWFRKSRRQALKDALLRTMSCVSAFSI